MSHGKSSNEAAEDPVADNQLRQSRACGGQRMLCRSRQREQNPTLPERRVDHGRARSGDHKARRSGAEQPTHLGKTTGAGDKDPIALTMA